MNNKNVQIFALLILVVLLTTKIYQLKSEVSDYSQALSRVNPHEMEVKERMKSQGTASSNGGNADIRELVAEVLFTYQATAKKELAVTPTDPQAAKISSAMVKIMMGVLARHEGKKITNDPIEPIAPLPDPLAQK